MAKLGLVINLDTCSDMRGCMVACKRETNSFLGSHFIDTHTVISKDFPNPNTYFIHILCQHCDNPSCVTACPTKVFEKKENGIVTVGDTNLCKLCPSTPCLNACPYSAIDYDPVAKVVGKCDLCVDLIEEGKAPACVCECLSNSLFFGDLDDPESIVSEAIKNYGEHVHRLLPESGNGPNVYYLLSSKRWVGKEGLYSPAWHNVRE